MPLCNLLSSPECSDSTGRIIRLRPWCSQFNLGYLNPEDWPTLKFKVGTSRPHWEGDSTTISHFLVAWLALRWMHSTRSATNVPPAVVGAFVQTRFYFMHGIASSRFQLILTSLSGFLNLSSNTDRFLIQHIESHTSTCPNDSDVMFKFIQCSNWMCMFLVFPDFDQVLIYKDFASPLSVQLQLKFPDLLLFGSTSLVEIFVE